jgi:hypothetical protein
LFHSFDGVLIILITFREISTHIFFCFCFECSIRYYCSWIWGKKVCHLTILALVWWFWRKIFNEFYIFFGQFICRYIHEGMFKGVLKKQGMSFDFLNLLFLNPFIISCIFWFHILILIFFFNCNVLLFVQVHKLGFDWVSIVNFEFSPSKLDLISVFCEYYNLIWFQFFVNIIIWIFSF